MAATYYLDVLRNHFVSERRQILFFGASVTEQRAGYVFGFQEAVKEKKCDIDVVQKGIGAVHLREACLLLPAVLNKMEALGGICMLEWLTSYPLFDKEQVEKYLTFLLRELRTKRFLPVFVFMYNNEFLTERKETKKVWTGYAHRYRIPTIDMFDFQHSHYGSTPAYFRDNTHLTADGGKFFGTTLFTTLAGSLTPLPLALEPDRYMTYNIERVNIFAKETPTASEVKISSRGPINVFTVRVGDVVKIPDDNED